MNADSPTPNSDSARPVATWFARSVSAITAKIVDSAAAASAPAPTPSHGDCVCAATMNEAIAPTSIIPSTPRFSTPDFSTTSSPSAANTSGVPAARLNSTSWANVSTFSHPRGVALAGGRVTRATIDAASRRRRGLHDAHAEIHEDIRRQQEEQQRPLEEPGHRRRQCEVHLRRFAAEVQKRHQDAGGHDAERMEPAN